jgi:hypothetical protein
MRLEMRWTQPPWRAAVQRRLDDHVVFHPRQHVLPWNPRGFAAVRRDLAFNFGEPFNWQACVGGK